jgi:hypothetical protein
MIDVLALNPTDDALDFDGDPLPARRVTRLSGLDAAAVGDLLDLEVALMAAEGQAPTLTVQNMTFTARIDQPIKVDFNNSITPTSVKLSKDSSGDLIVTVGLPATRAQVVAAIQHSASAYLSAAVVTLPNGSAGTLSPTALTGAIPGRPHRQAFRRLIASAKARSFQPDTDPSIIVANGAPFPVTAGSATVAPADVEQVFNATDDDAVTFLKQGALVARLGQLASAPTINDNPWIARVQFVAADSATDDADLPEVELVGSWEGDPGHWHAYQNPDGPLYLFIPVGEDNFAIGTVATLAAFLRNSSLPIRARLADGHEDGTLTASDPDTYTLTGGSNAGISPNPADLRLTKLSRLIKHGNLVQ